MKQSLVATALAALVASSLGAQTPAASEPLHLPRAVKMAFQKATRSPDGKPGARYWQNRGRYNISLTVAPPERLVRGSEQIAYRNESPDTLRTLVIKLFMNVHKPGVPRLNGAPADYLTSGVHVDAFTVNGATQRWGDDTNVQTWRRVVLPTPLAPRDSVKLAFDWHYDLATQPGREGPTDSTTFYLAYFYPRVAVYDDYNGWDTMDFTDGQEFYSDFNDYDVTVRAPANFVVWGTGDLVNARDVLQPEILRRFQASLTSDTTIRVATKADMQAKRVTAQGGTNAWRFTARDVPDVAFNVSDHFVWDAGSVVVDAAAKRRASVQAAYNDTAPDFPHMVKFAREALDYFSRVWPGVPYPYPKSTIVQGFADMEYPMMVNDGSNADTTFSRFVAEHEIAHTYFPFYMGINETRYGFMDEGWATTFEYLRNVSTLGPQRAAAFFKQFRVQGWIRDPSALEDLPIIIPGDVLKGVALGNNEYGKAALGYLAAKDLLGDATFKRALQTFMDRWHGKHPIPWDFFNTLNDVTKQNLNWFWNAWYFQPTYIDIGVASATKSSSGYTVTLDNVGGMPAPVDLVTTYDDGSTETFHQTPSIWAPNMKRAIVSIPAKRSVRSIALEGGIWMDADKSNDQWRAAVP